MAHRIVVRTSGPDHSPESAAALVAKTFTKLYELMHRTHYNRIAEATPIHDTDVQYAKGMVSAQIVGMCAFFSQLLRFSDPRYVSYQGFSPWDVSQQDIGHVHDTILNWAINRPTVAENEDTDDVWELFFSAVTSARAYLDDIDDSYAQSRAHTLIAELEAAAPQANHTREWSWRVWSYARDIVPEYRRWFDHLLEPAEVPLPRI